ncbi:MAG: hypothetical protein ACLSVD_03230 [Eggerthellaceae bacterium]
MTTLFASPRLFIATVDFNLEICPILVNAQEVRGCWITLDYCQEGRCEVAMPGESAIIVKPGDCCLSASRRLPSEYRYPLGRYRGIKLCFSDGVTNEPAYGVMREAGFFGPGSNSSTCGAVRGDDQLNALMSAVRGAGGPVRCAAQQAAVHGGAAARQGAGVADGAPTFVLHEIAHAHRADDA